MTNMKSLLKIMESSNSLGDPSIDQPADDTQPVVEASLEGDIDVELEHMADKLNQHRDTVKRLIESVTDWDVSDPQRYVDVMNHNLHNAYREVELQIRMIAKKVVVN